MIVVRGSEAVATAATVGGTSSAARNVISGVSGSGVFLDDVSSILIQGNYIGIDKSDSKALSNGTGVHIDSGAPGNTIGGTTAGTRNIIAGDTLSALVFISDSENMVLGNYIGTNSDGTIARGRSSGSDIFVNGNNNKIGGTETGASNKIAFSLNEGVRIAGGTGNSVRRNSIFENRVGISSNAFPPVLTFSGGAVKATLSGVPPNTPFTVEFFSNPTCDPNATGSTNGGKIYLSEVTKTTDASGNASFDGPVGQNVTATASAPGINTSQFPKCVTGIAPPPQGQISLDPTTPLTFNANEGGAGDATRFPETLVGLFEKQGWAINASSWLALNTFWVGLLFFFARSLVLHVLQAMPGPMLAPLRHILTKRQLKLRWKAKRAREGALWRRTVLRWSKEGFQLPNEQTVILEWQKIPDNLDSLKRAVEASRRARKIVVKLSRRFDMLAIPSQRQVEKIATGLCQLYSLTFNRPLALDSYSEIFQWKTEMTESVRAILTITDTEVFRSGTEARSKLSLFPDEERWLAPTALGNRFASLDDYAEKRYGIDTSTLWKRMWGVLSKEDRKEVSDAQLNVEVLANLSVAFVALTLGVILFSKSDLLFILIPLFMALVSYRAAIYAAGALTEAVVRLVDLHRLHLIDALGFKSPRTVYDERKLFKELHSFFSKGTELPAGRELTSPKPAKAHLPRDN